MTSSPRNVFSALRRFGSWPAAMVAVLLCGMVASAASYMRTSLKELTGRAAAVVEVEVLGKQFPPRGAQDRFPRTHVELQVLRVLKGEVPERFVLDIPGGIDGTTVGYVPDGPDFKTGERAVVFVKEPARGRFMVQDLGLGKFNVVEREGQAFVESPLCPRAMAPAAADDDASLLSRSIPYTTFCELIGGYAAGAEPSVSPAALAATLPRSSAHGHGIQPAVLADAQAAQAVAGVRRALLYSGIVLTLAALAAAWWVQRRRKLKTAPISARAIVFLLSGGLAAGAGLGATARAFVTFEQRTIWNLDKSLAGKVESGRIVWKQSTVSKTNANVFSSVQTSYNRWASVAGSRLAFTAGGAGSATTNDSQDDENVVAWSVSPSDDFSDRTLAITFSSFSVGTASNFLDGDIIFNDRDFDWSANGRGNAASVSLHEIGHFVGLNHTTDMATVMFPFDKGLTALSGDEIAAAQALYPGTNSGTVTVGPKAVAAASPDNGLPTLAVSFNGTASTPGVAGDPLTTFAWNFGDGQSATGATVAHSYPALGIYTASLTVTDSAGASSVSMVTIRVGEAATPGKAQFRLNFKSEGKDMFKAVLTSQAVIGSRDIKGEGGIVDGSVTIGDQPWLFEFDTEKGKSVNKDGAKVTVNDKKGTVTVQISNADLRDVLGGHGAVDEDVDGVTVSVPVIVWFGDEDMFVFGDFNFNYKAKEGKMGQGKQ